MFRILEVERLLSGLKRFAVIFDQFFLFFPVMSPFCRAAAVALVALCVGCVVRQTAASLKLELVVKKQKFPD